MTKTGKKVFRITENTFEPGERKLTGNHSFIDMSARPHYPGEHQLAIIVNGVGKAKKQLMLTR
jgi:hypothetical protein